MGMKTRVGGAWKDIIAARVFASGAWRSLVGVKVYSDGAWRDVANFTSGGGSITLAISPSPVTAQRRNATVQSLNVTATPTGGIAPYTYSWVKQSGDDITALSPSAAVTKFVASGMDELEERSAVFRCTGTDSLGSTDSEDVTVTLTRLEDFDLGGEF